MYSINGARSGVPGTYRQLAAEYANIPLTAIRLQHNPSTGLMNSLQGALASAWNPTSTSAAGNDLQRGHLDLQKMGLVQILSSARLIPPWIDSVSLDNNHLLGSVPGDLSDQLRRLSVRNDKMLRHLPNSLPRGLTMEVAGSGLTPDYLRYWMALHPSADVRFTDAGVTIEPDGAARVVQAGRRERDNWQARTNRVAGKATNLYPPVLQYRQSAAGQPIAAEVEGSSDGSSLDSMLS